MAEKTTSLSNVSKSPNALNEFLRVNRTDVRVGSCMAVVDYTTPYNTLIFVANRQPGNGDFARLMDYLEAEAKNDDRPLEVVEIWNKRLRRHLITKRGYVKSKRGVIKK